MWILFDLILIAIIALCTFLGYKRGLAKALVKIASFFLAILISFIIYKPVSNYVINNTTLQSKLESSITSNLTDRLGTEDVNTEVQVSSFILDYIQGSSEEFKTATIFVVAKGLSELLIKVIIFILIFIIIKVLLLIVLLFTDIITKLPLLKQFNEIGGLIYGLLKGILIIYLILGLISLLSGLINLSYITDTINSTIITKYLYNNNFLFMILF